MTILLRAEPTAGAIPDRFKVANAGRSETFALGEDFTAIGSGRYLNLRGVEKVIALNLWTRPARMKGSVGCPDVAELFARASGSHADAPEAIASHHAPTAKTPGAVPAAGAPPQPPPVTCTPHLPAAVLAVRPALADTSDVVVDRINGRRSLLAGGEDALQRHGWNEVIDQVNAEARTAPGATNQHERSKHESDPETRSRDDRSRR